MSRDAYRTRDDVRAMVERIHAAGFNPTVGEARIDPTFNCDGSRFNRIRDEWYAETKNVRPRINRIPLIFNRANNKKYVTIGVRATRDPARPEESKPELTPTQQAISDYKRAARKVGLSRRRIK